MPSLPTAALLLLLPAAFLNAADHPQWGAAWDRNMTSAETGLPVDFDPASGRNVKWTAALGTETHSTPVIAGGRIFIGTNNGRPRDDAHKGDRGVLMCFSEKDGSLLWQLVVPKRTEDRYFDWPNSGISSPATVEGDRVYVVSNRGVVLCLDVHGMANGNDGPVQDEGRLMRPAEEPAGTTGALDADIIWSLDLTREAGIWSHDAAHSSILIDGPFLWVNTGTGVDNTHKLIRTPDAPSLIVLEKATGRIAARDQEKIAPDVFHCTWSAPSMATAGGEKQIFFGGGNGILYSFRPLLEMPDKPAALDRLWRFTFDPAAPVEKVHTYNTNRQEGPSNFFGMPVISGERLYLAGGGDLWWGKNEAWLKCIDPAPKPAGDRLKWSYPLNRHVMATPAVHDGLIYIPDTGGTLHCVDAATGHARWTHDGDGEYWASAFVADGKVWFASRRGRIHVFAASGEKKLLAEWKVDAPVSATPVAANGVLYFASMKTLYAVRDSLPK